MAIAVLAGGVGAARFLQGLLAVHRPSDITIISNVGDDCECFGLHVSPDIDIVLYHLAGLADEERGFGLKDDTFNVIDAHRRLRLRHLVPPRRPRPRHVHHAHRPAASAAGRSRRRRLRSRAPCWYRPPSRR